MHVLVAAAAGCYHPNADVACAVSCENGAACPGALECGPDQLCRAHGAPPCTAIGSDAGACYGHLGITICAPAVDGDVTPTQQIDTGNCQQTITDISGQKLCLISGTSITLAPGLTRASGSHPLVLFAALDIRIPAGSALDVSSHLGQPSTGPAANDASCPHVDGMGSSTIGGGGGAGGSFRALPELGGSGGTGSSPSSITAAGVPQAFAGPITALRGGCPGGNGGNHASPLGVGGASGGAVYLLAGHAISIGGTIDASGAGGVGGPATPTSAGGGGGGGAGGFVVFDAMSTNITGTVIALGGGGGGGGSVDTTSTLFVGASGGDPDVIFPTTAASAGIGGNPNAGNGGVGSIMDGAGGNASNAAVGASRLDGGGGGGGGGGHIYIYGNGVVTGPVAPAVETP